ncbi:MAG: hypothetical protein AAB740_01760, partial [Patescibacteria group bacterium]
MKKQNIFYVISLIAIVFVFVWGVNLTVAGWVSPTALPTRDNAKAPIHIGLAAQIKDGNLAVNAANLYSIGFLVPHGNVGIGTTKPASLLNLYSPNATNTTVGTKENRIYMQHGSVSSVDTGGEIVFGLQDVGTGRYAAIGTSIEGTGAVNQISGGLYLATKGLVTDSTLTKRLVVLGNGNVGIGTTEPSGKLTVSVPANSSGIEAFTSTAGNTHLPWSNNWNYISGKGVIFRDPSNVEKMRLDATSGNVGIGTTDPGSKLHVNGDIDANGWVRSP